MVDLVVTFATGFGFVLRAVVLAVGLFVNLLRLVFRFRLCDLFWVTLIRGFVNFGFGLAAVLGGFGIVVCCFVLV